MKQLLPAELIEQCRALAMSHLKPLLARLFANSDVALLDFARKAEDNVSQQGFFDAMGEIQNKRDAILGDFFDDLNRIFRHFGTYAPDESGTDCDWNSQSLSLQDKQSADEEVAIHNMVRKANARCQEDLAALCQRFAVLNQGRKLQAKHLPASPLQLALAFRAATRQLNLEPRTKLIVYALFDRFVLTQCEALYRELNRVLVEAGILPSLRYEVSRQTSNAQRQAADPDTLDDMGEAKATTSKAASGNSRQGNVGDEVLHSIIELLTGRTATGAVLLQSRPQGSRVGPNDHAAMATAPALVAAAESVQREAASPEQSTPELAPDNQTNVEQQAVLTQINEQLHDERDRIFARFAPGSVPAMDANIIDLVGMMFDYMLDDDDIPNAVKALLSRLHTPYLKLALMDRNFFSDTDHSARTFLNECAAAGSRWVLESELDRGAFPCLQEIVQEILSGFGDDLELFQTMLTRLRTRIQELETASQRIEDRARQAVIGQERLNEARQRARETVRERVTGQLLPEDVLKLLQESWADTLTFILLRDSAGEQSESWRNALATMDTIIASTLIPGDEEARSERRRTLEEINRSLEAQLGKLARYCSDVERILLRIRAAQQVALSELAADLIAAPAPPEADLHVRNNASVRAMTEHEERIAQRLETLKFGRWFEFDSPDTGRRYRLKLAWFAKASGQFMFVDRMGVKAGVFNKYELAAKIHHGQARILESESPPFFDRAMRAVRGVLRRPQPKLA